MDEACAFKAVRRELFVSFALGAHESSECAIALLPDQILREIFLHTIPLDVLNYDDLKLLADKRHVAAQTEIGIRLYLGLEGAPTDKHDAIR